MPHAKLRTSGVQGIGLIAITYVYFLIFAQFAFIHRLDALGISGSYLKSVMAAMAIGGILLSLLAPAHFMRLHLRRSACSLLSALQELRHFSPLPRSQSSRRLQCPSSSALDSACSPSPW